LLKFSRLDEFLCGSLTIHQALQRSIGLIR
jgi:hypothetical protein